MNRDKLRKIIEQYKKDFLSRQWEKEKYKWEAVKHFQDNWDIDAEDFSEMFMKATSKTYNLLTSQNKFPRGMVSEFAHADEEATRAMFIGLYDESKDIFKRIKEFNFKSEELRNKYGSNEWSSHFQDLNTISTYLWLHYPDKYYIYKYSLYKEVVKELESDSIVKTGINSKVYCDFFTLYNEICKELKKGEELKEKLKSVLTEDFYEDPELKTMTIDFGYYLKNAYLLELEDERIKNLLTSNPILGSIVSAEDMDPDSHDGSYELLRETIKSYSKINSDYIDLEDLDVIYSIVVGTWKIGISNKKERLDKSNLNIEEKERLKNLIDEIMIKSKDNEYSNNEYNDSEDEIGMFGTGFMTFKGKSTPDDAKKFINLLIRISELKEEDKIIKLAEENLKDNIGGIQAGVASMILHCLEPKIFPILTSAVLEYIGILEDVGVVLNKGSKLTHYIKNSKKIKDFRDKYCKFKNYRVLDLQLRKADKSYWYPTKDEYDPNINLSKWIELLNNKEIFTESSLKIMKRLKDHGGIATCTQLANKYGNSINFYNAGSSSLARRVAKKTNCPLNKRVTQSTRWWTILYLGKDAGKDIEGSWIWKMRKELSEALEQIDLSEIPLYENEEKEDINYWWLNANPNIWSFSNIKVNEIVDYTIYNEKGNKRRIHQNFLDAKKGDIVIGYETSPDKKIVALGKIEENDDENIYIKKTKKIETPIGYDELKENKNLEDMEFFKSPQGSFFKVTKEEYDSILDMIKDEDKKIVDDEIFEPYSKEDFLNEVFISEDSYNTLKALLNRKQNIILQGPPGVGKTFIAKRLAYSIIGEKDKSKIEMIQFHQSYSYEDFIMGYRPSGSGFKLKEGPFYKFCKKAEKNLENDYYFIIDEINRGNLSKIFGELMMLLENDKRGQELKLTYSDKPFSVPKNIYIIGMMNTADRSLAIIDYALRRRFSFFDIEPAFESEGFKNLLIERGMEGDLIETIKTKISRINLDIKNDINLGKGFKIGHSYFCDYEKKENWYKEVIRYEIAPLIREYWFDEEEKAKNYVEELLR